MSKFRAKRNERPLFTEDEWIGICEMLDLSRRQAEVLHGVLNGLGDRAIADELQIAPPTVRTHLQKLFRRMGVCDRTEMVVNVFKAFRHHRRYEGNEVPPIPAKAVHTA